MRQGRTEENKKNRLAEKWHGLSLRAKILAVAGLLLALVFCLRLFAFSLPAPYKSKEVKANREEVKTFQGVSVESVERAYEALNIKVITEGSNSLKARYMRRFEDTLVVGDSLTEGLSVYGWLSEDQVYSEIGASVLTSEKLFKTAAATHPKAAFFAFGMNDMGNYSGDAEAFTKQYAKLLADFAETSPDSQIIVVSITTPTEKAQEGNKAIRDYKKFNEAIKKMTEEEGYTYLDISDILEEHPELYAEDGIHAQSEYYLYWLNRMSEAAGLD